MGILGAAGVVFFAFIGFDAVSTAAQEAKNPKKDMPIGILGSLAVCTVLYVCSPMSLAAWRRSRSSATRPWAARRRCRRPSRTSCPVMRGSQTS
jgi:amino acid transporter